MEYDLDPCPFCGTDVKKDDRKWLGYDRDRFFSVSCKCGAFGPKTESKEKAIMAWNRRESFHSETIWKPFNYQNEKGGFKGKLSAIEFSSILQFLSTVDKTGLLQVHNGHRRCAICFKNGQVIATSRNYGQQLGEMLFDKGLISLDKLQTALSTSKNSGKHLGETLMDLKYIDQDTLRNLIRHQVSETIEDLMQWKEGSFNYQDHVIEFDERGVEDINIMGLLLNASKISDELSE